MKNPFSNETVKSAAIVIGSAVAFIAISKGVSVLRKKFGYNDKAKAIFGGAENADRSKCMNGMREASRNVPIETDECPVDESREAESYRR